MHPTRAAVVIERSRIADEEGISLVEMLVAILVLALVMGAMVQSLAASLFSVQRQEKQVHATALAAELIETAVSLPWGHLGLCETEALIAYPGGQVDGEPVVLLDDGDEVCASAGDPLLVPTMTRERPTGSAVEYDVATVVTWHDDVQDDDASGNDPNTEQDIKRIRVTVSWDVRGEAVSYSAETFRAPGGTQVGLQTRVEHAAGAEFTYLHDSSTLTKTDVYLRLFAGTPQTAVSVSWEANDTDGDGQPETITRAMENPTSDRMTWQFLIPNGSPEFAVNNLPNAEVLFTFTATDANGTPTDVLDRGLFLIEPGVDGQAEGHHITAVNRPEQIVVKDGVVCPFEVTATVRGALGSDPVTITWSAGPAPAGMKLVGSTSEDATFSASFGGPDTPVFAGSSVDYTVTAERPADSQTETAEGQIPVVLQVGGEC